MALLTQAMALNTLPSASTSFQVASSVSTVGKDTNHTLAATMHRKIRLAQDAASATFSTSSDLGLKLQCTILGWICLERRAVLTPPPPQ